MRRITLLMAVAAIAGTAAVSAPAHAVGVSTCVAAAEVSVLGPNGAVYVEEAEFHGVGSCV